MNHSQEIMTTLFASTRHLNAEAVSSISEFLHNSFSDEGGFINRAGKLDLYYSMFGLTASAALGVELPVDKIQDRLTQFEPESLGLIDLTSITKTLLLSDFLNHSKKAVSEEFKARLIQAMQKFRTANGSFSYDGKRDGLPYAVFLAMNFYLDLETEMPEPEKVIAALESYLSSDGRFSNPESHGAGLLLSTVAGLLSYKQLTGRILNVSLEWVKAQMTDSGGFKADPKAQLPDMLSTAVALFALQSCNADISAFKSRSLEFVKQHWLANGGFSATLLDETGDCEYVYYGLLSLGVLTNV